MTGISIGAVAGAMSPRASGGTTTFTGTGWIHMFTSSDTFTVFGSLPVSGLLVAGGYNGGSGAVFSSFPPFGGKGGDGGKVVSASTTLADGSHTVTVGASGGDTSSVSGWTSASGSGSKGGRGGYFSSSLPRIKFFPIQGGSGTASTITGSSVVYGSGGGGGGASIGSSTGGAFPGVGGGSGGGGNGDLGTSSSGFGALNFGAGGGGGGAADGPGGSSSGSGGAGRSGVVIISYQL